MEIDPDRIDEAVLALLFLGRHDGVRTWKSFDWAAMERLHAKGLISDPVGKAKSVAFTKQGLLQSEALFRTRSEFSSPICSNRGAGLKPRTCFSVTNSISP
jgi:hypothetical protein